MISILSRLICPVMRCIKYGSCLSTFKSQKYYLRVMMRNHTVSVLRCLLPIQHKCPKDSLETSKRYHDISGISLLDICAVWNRPVYRTRLALPVDYDRVMTFMNDAFFKEDPTMVNIGLNEQEPAPSLLKLMYDELREGMTIIAEGEDNCIVGAAVNAGSCPWDPDRFVEFARCCECGPTRDVIEFEAYVTRKPNLWEHYCVLKIFECSYLAVKPDFRDQGIARKLVLDSWYLARDCGYRLFRVDCSNRYTARIAEGYGWKQVCTIPFHQYVKDGKLVFKHIKEPHTEVQIYIDQVTFCKNYCPPYKKCKTTSAPKISEKKS